MVREKSPTWNALIAAALRNAGYDPRAALKIVGLKVKEQLQQSIVEGEWEPLAPATEDRKGFSTPLIDSHNMINAVDYKVL